jgi:hypothetical protein
MIKSLLVSVTGILILMIIWVVVQKLWGKTFADYYTDEDVLAERRDCGNCGCTTACENKRQQVSSK